MKPNIFPVMRYADAPASMDWLVRAFGFEKQAEHPGPDGAVVHAELRIGASAIMVSSATPPVASNPWSGVLQGVYVTLQEVDAHHDRARAAGAEIVTPLYDTAYGSREYAARDLEGHFWGFGTYSPESGDGEPDLFPELRCRTPAAIGWLARAFGFRPTAEIPGPDGAIVHAEMRLGDGTVMLGIGTGDGQWSDRRQAVSVRLDDPDAHFERARAAGAVIVQPPTTTHYGARSYWALDPEGFVWGFSTYKPADPPRERE